MASYVLMYMYMYWINQDIVFDYTADLAGTGDRSEYISRY